MIKIAFCDDDMEVLHQMNELLDRYRVERNEDITYAAFQSPFELLTEIEKGIRPDILFLDVVMPGINGYQVCKLIKSKKTAAKTAVVMLSSKNSTFDKIRATMSGCDTYLTKPVNENRLFEVISKYLPTNA